MGCPLPAGRGGFCEGSAVSGTRGVLQDPLERGWAGGSELCWEEQRAGVRRPARGSSRALTSVWLRYVPHHVRTFMSGAFRYQLRGVSLRRDWSTGAATTRNPNDGQLVLVPKLAPHPGPGYGCHVHGVVRPS